MVADPLFPVGRIATGDDLVGREGAIGDLMRRLRAGQSLIIAGPRRIGKTSVLEEALRRLRKEGYCTGRVDLLRVSTKAELAESLADVCFENLTRTVRTFRALREWASGRAPEIELKASLGPEADLALSLALGAGRLSEAEFLDNALALPQQVAERRKTRFVLAYDEFQEISKLNSGLLGRMRAAMILQDRVTFVFLGSQESMLQSLFTKRNEPFYRFATNWSLPPVPEEAWRDYLLRKYRAFGFDPTPQAVAEITRRAGGHPMDTMLLANEAAYAAQEAETKAITADMVAVAFERTMVHLGRAFEDAWRELDPVAQHVLKRLVAGAAPYGKPAPNPAQIKRAIDRLLAAGILDRQGKGRYRFVEAMFAEYIRRTIL